MPDYKAMYLKMFGAAENAINTAEEAVTALQNAAKALTEAQLECEEMYLSSDTELRVLTFQETSDKKPKGE